MKKQASKKTIWQSLISLMVMGILIVTATGSLEMSQLAGLFFSVPIRSETKYMGNDIYTETTQIGQNLDSYLIMYEYQLDEYGRKHGPMTRTNTFITSNLAYVHETVNMVHGLRHGKATTTYGDGTISYRCYDMGVKVDCNKAAHITPTESSAYQIINNKYPWYLSSLNAFGFDNEYVETFTDSIESIMYGFEFEEDDFGEYFEIAIDSLKLTPYDSIINLYPVINYMYGLELMKNNEFRLALIDYNRSSENSTFEIVNNTYPGYLQLLHVTTDPDQDFDEFRNDFENFCMHIDSLMISYGKLDAEDPFFIDSVDSRIFRAINTVESMEEPSSTALVALKSAVLINNIKDRISTKHKINSVLSQMLLDNDPNDIAQSVLFSMIIEYLQGNLLIYSVLEAYHINNNSVTIPTVTTDISQNHPATSLTIDGYVHDNGRAEITERGIVWGTIYNPTLENNTILAGTGTGSFNASASGLTEGVTYYTRAYATNSAGTAYGNCINFTARNTVGIEDKEINNFDFKIYPNPASEFTTLKLNTQTLDQVEVTIVNLNGQVVNRNDFINLSYGENELKINVSGLKNGIYNCRLANNKTIIGNSKLLINR